MKYLWTLSMALLVTLAAQAQVTVSGTITDAAGAPLAGASVVLKNTFKGTQTDAQGAFRLTEVQPGDYTVVVSYVGYSTAQRPLIVSQVAPTIDIALQESSIVADEVVVQGTRARANTPITFTTLERNDIARVNVGQDMPQILEFTPSAVTTSDAGNGIGYTGIRIRGTDPTRINVTINGVPLNDAESQGVFWVNLPDFASSTESVQIQRGVGTSTNGGSAFGATVNLLTNKLNPEPYGELNTTVGSFGTAKNTLRLGSGLIGGKFTLDGRVSRIVSDGYIDRASSDLFSYYLSGAYYGNNQSLRFNVFHGQEVTYQAWYGVTQSQIDDLGRTYNPAGTEKPGTPYDRQVDDYQQTHYQLVYNRAFSRQLDFNATLHYTRGAGFYEEYKAGENLADYGILDTSLVASDLVRRRWLDNDFYGVVYSLDYRSTNEKWQATLGGGWNNYIGRHFGRVIDLIATPEADPSHEYYFNEATKNDFNLYLKNTYALSSRLNAFLDLQYRRIGYQFGGVDQDGSPLTQQVDFNFFNPKAGLTFELAPQSALFAYFGVANKEPNRDDFVDNPPSSQPRPERLYDVEMGYRKATEKLAFSANYYMMYYRDQLVLTGRINDVGEYIRTNIDRSYRTGIEVEGQWKINRHLEWAANATFSQNRVIAHREFVDAYDAAFNWIGQEAIDHENTDIAFSPSWIGGSVLRYYPLAHLDAFAQQRQLFVAWQSKYVGRQYVDNANGQSLDPYFLQDVNISYTHKLPRGIFKAVTISAWMRNAFDEDYISNAWTYRYNFDGALAQDVGLYPQAGRNYFLTVNLTF